MLRATHNKTTLDVLSLPTAPFVEGRVHSWIAGFCGRLRGVRMKSDPAGNLLVHYRHGATRVAHPVCLTAHTDHPGFVAEDVRSGHRVRAAWRGGVKPEYFTDARVRFRVDDHWVRGRIVSTRTTGKGAARKVASAEIDVPARVPAGSPGMWDLPDARIRNGRFYARACDDLAGVAAMLCCLETLARTRARTEAYFLFTRAEEVGFVGAMAACRARTIPGRCVVVAIETSAERPNARIGDGPILRVGDKATTYYSPATRYCQAVAEDLRKTDKVFTYQRRLMDGGTCESTAYCQLGYEATGICVALGNYHNMNTRTGRIGPEYISVSDFASLVKWFVALTTARQPYTGVDAALQKRLKKIEKEYAALLRRTRPAPKR
jgi:endoglucanase